MIAALVVVVAVRALAAEAPLTPDDAVRLALDRSGQIQAAKLAAEKNAIRRAITLDPLKVTVGHHALDEFVDPIVDNNLNPYGPLDGAYIALGVKLPGPVELADVAGNDAAARADALDVEDQKNELAAQVRTLHAQVLSLRDETKLAESGLAILVELERQTNERLKAEAATAFDARLATLARIDAAADVEDMRANVDRTEHRLGALLGKSAPLELAAPAHPLCQAAPGSLDALLARARERSPHLQALDALRQRAALDTSLSWAAYLPYVDGFGIGYYNAPLDKLDTVHAHLDFALPIFEPFVGKSRTAAVEQQRLDAIYLDESRQVDADVRSAYDKLSGALALVKVYDDSRPAILEGLDDVHKALEAGQADVFKVADIQSRALTAERGGLHARAKCEAAAVDLARLIGDTEAR